MKYHFILFLIIIILPISSSANVRLPKIFNNFGILQRDQPINIWGWADNGERVTVKFNNQTVFTRADQKGKWAVVLRPMPAGGPYDLVVKGKNTVVLHDILLGEVWLCSGQSNMEFGLNGALNAKTEISKANYPTIRQFKIKDEMSATPLEDVAGGDWQVCSPSTAGNFTAVGYYFAKFLYSTLHVPIGIINATKGGTYIESWMSVPALNKLADYKQVPALTKNQLENWFENVESLYSYYGQKLGVALTDTFKTDDSQWQKTNYNDSNWINVQFPADFDKTVLPRFDGTAWFRASINIKKSDSINSFVLNLGEIKDEYEFYINGHRINSSTNTDTLRQYKINSDYIVNGQNTLSIKIINYWEIGGFISNVNSYYIQDNKRDDYFLANLQWKMNIASVIRLWIRSPNVHTSLLFNGMIHPIEPYSIKGILWYQGENNEGFADQYRDLLPALISNWRDGFKQGSLPFYFVQLPNFKKFNQNSQNGGATWAELRESQLKTLSVPNTGMAVTVDVGDSTNIHPKDKEDVGKRLALIALHKLYGISTEFSGPEFDTVKLSAGKIIITFKSDSAALVAKDRYGCVRGFEIAGSDQRFYYAKAEIVGNKIILQNNKVQHPVAVRYDWSNNPDGNLYNSSNLPASPFRTDTWKLTTEGKKFDLWIGNHYKFEYKKP